jgi:ketosteroid isomerase-like protein
MDVQKSVGELQAFAREWIANWNARDIEAVISHMSNDATFISPLALEITGHREVRGSDALRSYWREASLRSKSLRFILTETICDEASQTMVVCYIAEKDGAARQAAEIMRFVNGQQASGEALYGAAL